MAIVREQPGASKAAAQAGTAIGKAKGTERSLASAERKSAMAMQIGAQQVARKAALDWEQEKMAMRSQQDFQQELAEKQWDYEKFNRAKAWDLEKMEIASRNDFQQEERERQEKLNKWMLGRKAIEDSDTVYHTQEQKDEALWKWDTKHKTGLYPPSVSAVAKPLSARAQLTDIEATQGLGMYTMSDLREDFPDLTDTHNLALYRPLCNYSSVSSNIIRTSRNCIIFCFCSRFR